MIKIQVLDYCTKRFKNVLIYLMNSHIQNYKISVKIPKK